MRLMLLFAILTIAVFVGTYFLTRDPLLAVVAGWVVTTIYLLVMIIQQTAPPFPAKLRIFSIAVILISCGSVAAPFVEGHDTGYWQRSMLLGLRSVIANGLLQSVMSNRAIATLRAYHDPGRPPGETFRQTFDRLNPRLEPGSDVLLDSLFQIQFETQTRSLDTLWEYIRVSAIGDSEIVMRGVNAVQERQEAILAKMKIHIEAPVPIVHVSAKGVTYEPYQ